MGTDTNYSDTKKTHTLKSQVAVDETTSMIVDISTSVRGPTADIMLRQESGVLTRWPSRVGAIGDLASIGIGCFLFVNFIYSVVDIGVGLVFIAGYIQVTHSPGCSEYADRAWSCI